MTVETTQHGEMTIAYERFGTPDGEPLLLIMGLGVQMVLWPDDFCAALAARGFAVARFDNRDAGLSTHLDGVRPPSVLRQTVRPRTPVPYRLEDMAADALSVCDALGWPAAHLVGISMGGMIAQTLAIRHPDRVRSLTTVASRSTMRFGRPKLAAYRVMRAPAPRSREDAVRQALVSNQIIGSPGYPADQEWIRQVAMLTYDRGVDAEGARRQLAAILAAGDLRPGLAGLRLPALVLHGESDIMAPLVCGKATAAAVPGARLVTYPGWGHDLPSALWPKIVDEIAVTTGI